MSRTANEQTGVTGLPGITDSDGRLIVVGKDGADIAGGSSTTVIASEGTPGSAAPAKALEVAGSDGTNLRTLKTSSTGQVDVTVPADPFGANADAAVAAGAAGSQSAKLRRISQGLEDLKSLLVLAAGSNTIGNVGLVAGTALVGQTAAGLQTGAIYSGATALTPKFALANISASTTDGAIVTAVTSKKIRVLAAVAVAAGTATTITFNSKPAGAGTAISAAFANAANGGEVLPFNPLGWFESAAGEGLTATTGAGSTTGVQVVYAEI